MNDPVLAAKTLPKGTDGYRVARTLKVQGGLHYLGGNTAPYFTLTCEVHRKGFPDQWYSAGADHSLILKHFPRFSDLAALHLSDIDGAPMHAVANGWYILAGYFDGAGERYHAGNSARHIKGEYRQPTHEECLQLFADYWRISYSEAYNLAECMRTALASDWSGAKDYLAREASRMAPIWKLEADMCIARHGLVVYGDTWRRLSGNSKRICASRATGW